LFEAAPNRLTKNKTVVIGVAITTNMPYERLDKYMRVIMEAGNFAI